jgi:hypothetical protein
MIRFFTLSIALATAMALSAQSPDAAAAKPHTFAQKLVDQELTKHSEVIILVFHISNTDGSDYPSSPPTSDAMGRRRTRTISA